MSYFAHYPADIVAQVERLLDENKAASVLLNKYPDVHNIRTDRALYDYVMQLKKNFMKQSGTISKVRYDDRVSAERNALGEHRFVSRVQGSKLKASNEIRIASVFKKAPIEFLRAICVHELAHLKEKGHDKAFYRLCLYMEPDYHQLEFEIRLFLAHQDKWGPLYL
ncbi:MAG: M48 family metallopeptidase [Deltaproteobacteria bacterium]|nr:M48 family metallopeptidase [Deltaproteobacteria bacterium]MBN2673760.1 M48 family metallopeptidase [Deltaproteobacteria bacterium]